MTRPSPSPPRVLRGGALRLAAVFAIVFAVASILYVAAVHLAVRHYARATLESAIEADITLVRGDDARGRAAMLRHFDHSSQTYYILVRPDGTRNAGTLPLADTQLGWFTVAMNPAAPTEDEAEPVEVRAKGVRLDDGSLLVVGRSLDASNELVEWLDDTALWSAFGIVLLALGGGWLIASVFLRRLDRVNAAIGRIMGGAFAERLPAIGMGAEFDTLAVRLNAMLDRIIALMEGQRQLSTNIAHDLRTPLTRVHQRLERTREIVGDPQAHDAIDAALRDLGAALATFGALLRLGTIETGTLRARFRSVDLGVLLTRLEEVFAPVAEDQDKSIAVSVHHEATILGDAELLGQLVSNVIENALIHAGPGTRISLSLCAISGEADITVADTGPGIPESERKNVTKRFYRFDASRDTPGAGLGLALVAAIVSLHGGRLTLADNNPGLKVSIALPGGITQ